MRLFFVVYFFDGFCSIIRYKGFLTGWQSSKELLCSFFFKKASYRMGLLKQSKGWTGSQQTLSSNPALGINPIGDLGPVTFSSKKKARANCF